MHVADRSPAVIELAPPGLVSSRVRTLAGSPSDSRRQPLRLTIWIVRFSDSRRGQGVAVSEGAEQGRTSVANELHAPERQACDTGFE